MEIIESFTTKNDCYKKNLEKSGSYLSFQRRGPIGLMLHSVGTPQPSAKVFVNNYNKPGLSAAVHAFLEPGIVYQTLPWEYRGWHAGGSANNTHLGIEMTEPPTIKYTGGSSWVETSDGKTTKNHVLATYETAVELFAELCDLFRLDPLEDGVIISHREGSKRGVASNHGDVEHIWNKFGLSMDKFRADVNRKMNNSDNEDISEDFIPYLVRVTANYLNYRVGPGVQHKIVGTVKADEVFTIVEEKNGWGRLKSNVGWINLKYTKRI